MDDAVRIPLIAGPHILKSCPGPDGAALRLSSANAARIQIPMLLPFQFFLSPSWLLASPFASFTGRPGIPGPAPWSPRSRRSYP